MPQDEELTMLRKELAEVRSQLAELTRHRLPGPIVDPAPWPYPPWVDPAPQDWPRWLYPKPDIPIPQPGDPAPEDWHRRAYAAAAAPAARLAADRAWGPWSPVVDPAPWDWGVRYPRRPIPIPQPGDPAPFDYHRATYAMAEAPAARAWWPWGPVVDPAPWDWGVRYPRRPIPIPRPGDPAPFDSARFRVVLGLDLLQVAGRILSMPADQVTMDDVARLHIGDVIGIEPGPVVDPAPDDVGRWVRIDPRLIRPIPWPGDPAPFDVGRFKTVENIPLVEAVAKISGQPADQLEVAALATISVRDLIKQFVRLPDGWEIDPPPVDYGRYAEVMRGRFGADLNVREISAMEKPELQATLHKVNAEITRLESLRELVEKRLEG